MRDLRIAKDLALPLEVVTQAIGILAKRRAGKSYLMRRLVEQLFGAGQQVVLVDPKGDQWGIRSSADGKHDGLGLVIFGGERGDVPLEPSSGALLAKLVVEESLSALLDLSLLRKHEVATFMAIFLEELYRLKAREQYRTPMMLVIDEADAIAPQKPQPNEARMLGAAQDIVRRGGQRGIGCCMVTQRSAVLSKDVLTQVQMLVTLRTIAPQDLAAIKAWVDVHGTVEQQKILMASLPSLPVGDAWFWSPGWPSDEGIFQRSHVLPITTYDSGATPKPGQKKAEPKRLGDVDLEAVRKQMAAVLERAKADDPRALRARIVELEKAAAGKPSTSVSIQRVEVEVPKPYVDLGLINGLRDTVAKHLKTFGKRTERACKLATEALAELDALAEALKQTSEQVERDFNEGCQRAMSRFVTDSAKRPAAKAAPNRRAEAPTEPAPRTPSAGGTKLGNTGMRRMLAALAQHGDGLNRGQLALLTGIARTGGTFSTYVPRLVKEGWAEQRGDRLVITAAGLAELGDYEELPTGHGLLEWWCNELGGGMAKMLRVLDEQTAPITRDELAELSGIERSGGTFSTYLPRLKKLELVEEESDGLVLSGELR